MLLVGKREVNNRLAGYTTTGQNTTAGIQRKNFSEVVLEGVRRRTMVFWGTR